MGMQSGLALFGFARQTAGKGVAIANPVFSHGLRDGAVLAVDVDQELEAVTLEDSLVAPGVNRTASIPGAAFTCRAYAKSIALWLYSALGAINTTGGGAPYTHAITPATDIPYLTGFGLFDGAWHKLTDLKVDELGLSWDGNEPLEVEVSMLGTNWTGFISAPSDATNEDALAAYFDPTAGTFKVDGDSATAVAAPIKSGSVKISNNLEAIILSGDIEPDDVFPGTKVMTVSLTIVPDDVGEWRAVVTGDEAAGTTVEQDTVYGSFDVKFVIDADTDLQIASTRVAFTADFPDVDAGGGPAEIQLEGMIVLPAAGGAAITATVRNSIASY